MDDSTWELTGHTPPQLRIIFCVQFLELQKRYLRSGPHLSACGEQPFALWAGKTACNDFLVSFFAASRIFIVKSLIDDSGVTPGFFSEGLLKFAGVGLC